MVTVQCAYKQPKKPVEKYFSGDSGLPQASTVIVLVNVSGHLDCNTSKCNSLAVELRQLVWCA